MKTVTNTINFTYLRGYILKLNRPFEALPFFRSVVYSFPFIEVEFVDCSLYSCLYFFWVVKWNWKKAPANRRNDTFRLQHVKSPKHDQTFEMLLSFNFIWFDFFLRLLLLVWHVNSHQNNLVQNSQEVWFHVDSHVTRRTLSELVLWATFSLIIWLWLLLILTFCHFIATNKQRAQFIRPPLSILFCGCFEWKSDAYENSIPNLKSRWRYFAFRWMGKRITHTLISIPLAIIKYLWILNGFWLEVDAYEHTFVMIFYQERSRL